MNITKRIKHIVNHIPKKYTKVTRLSKLLALSIYVFVTAFGFWMGITYQRELDLLAAAEKRSILYSIRVQRSKSPDEQTYNIHQPQTFLTTTFATLLR
jgi:hypothetical protein